VCGGCSTVELPALEMFVATFAVTAEKLTVEPHPNADRLELAQVGGYRAVVPAGQFRTGDLAVYIPEAAVLPSGLLDELGLTGKLAGAGRNRVKAVRLRGELSQGIVCRPASLNPAALADAYREGTDLAETLGITKWVPPVPTQMAGDARPAPALLPWPDIENIKRHPDLFVPGEPVVATEKIHGTACMATWDVSAAELLVSSKGLGARRLSLQPAEANLYWQVAGQFRFAELLAELADQLAAVRVGLFGEAFGAGIQDLAYGQGRGERAFAAFDLAWDSGDGVQRWADPDQCAELLSGRVPIVPELWRGGYDPTVLTDLAEGVEQVSGGEEHLREGIVVRAQRGRYAAQVGGRAIAKFVSDVYLTRKGGTEYE